MQRLVPSVEDASRDYVLIQAWKKASNYIRYHNWFADTLELDYQTANLPDFLRTIGEDMRSGRWVTDPLRLVLAPKSQSWEISSETNRWEPKAEQVELRPLAHVSLRDQVAATALMLCLADFVETVQGDPRSPRGGPIRLNTASYGNRLFCDTGPDGILEHRWGSSKLYRAFSEDYRTFVSRPDAVASNLAEPPGAKIVLVQSDLKQFYDRVRPSLLSEKLTGLLGPQADPGFQQLASQVLNWRWHPEDLPWAQQYAAIRQIAGFDEIALPQGLVAAGFFANVALLHFDNALITSRGKDIGDGVVLHDSCRYVDDLRLVAVAPTGVSIGTVEKTVFAHLQAVLRGTASGLIPSEEKTQAAHLGGEVRPLLRQSRKMERIQHSISGGFDIARGEEIIDAVQSLVRAQEHYSRESTENKDKAARNGRDKRLPVPDVKDATVARFAAARFRSTYRSLRPLLFDAEGEDADILPSGSHPELETGAELTKVDLDEEARNFALNLVQCWIENPSNVRLLRIGLDIWPSVAELDDVLDLLRPYLSQADSPARRVAVYSYAEIFKAGAIETGFVKDSESLSSTLDMETYRRRLADEAYHVLQVDNVPWYLAQQALLVLAVTRWDAEADFSAQGLHEIGTARYLQFIRFLRGDFAGLTNAEFATFSVMARRSVLNGREALELIGYEIDADVLREIAARDPGFAAEIRPEPDRVANDTKAALQLVPKGMRWVPLSDIFDPDYAIDLRHEMGVTSLLAALARLRVTEKLPDTLLPRSVEVVTSKVSGHDTIKTIRIVPPSMDEQGDPLSALYQVPGWCPATQRWRFQFGFLARFILTGRHDFTHVPRTSWREAEPVYRPVTSHWYKRVYGLHSGLEGFGDDWLAISEATEDLLYTLLTWPGCRERPDAGWLHLNPADLHRFLRGKYSDVRKCVGTGTQTLMLKVAAPLHSGPIERPLKGCVVQTVTPYKFDVADLTMSERSTRKKHRKHLTTALAAVEKMLELRATHEDIEKRLDWLILPELAVHPEDIERHIVPFARRYKAMVLAGVTYEEVETGLPAVNSAMWILPQMVPGRGLQMKRRRQGKRHLAAQEIAWADIGLLRSFRPAQWLVGYEWSGATGERPLWLSAAVCYDSTDLGLAADLRDRSDVFAIPALNKDVGTFDQMALALHYHMFQMVIVANNGRYGGSNAHVPKKEHYVKQVFHTHGQPQASISFFEIKDIRDMIHRRRAAVPGSLPEDAWKYPPAPF